MVTWHFWYVREDDGTPLLSRGGIPLASLARTSALADAPTTQAQESARARAGALADERGVGVCVRLQRGMGPSRPFDGPFLPSSA